MGATLERGDATPASEALAAEDAAFPATPAVIAGPWPSPRVAYYTLGILMLAFAVSFIDRTLLSLVVGPVQHSLSLSDTEIGLLQGLAFTILYSIAGFPLGRLADHRSRRGIIAAGIVAWSIFTAASGFARNYFQILVMRVGVGIGEASLSPAAVSMIADSFPPAQRSRAMGFYSCGVVLGAGLAYIVGGSAIAYITAHAHEFSLGIFEGFEPWRLAFIAIGIPGILFALLLLTVPEPARRGRGTTTAPTLKQSLLAIRGNWRTMTACTVGYGLLNIPFNGIIAWAPSYLHRVHHLGMGDVGLLLGTVFLIAGGSGQYLGGVFSDWQFSKGRKDATFRTGILVALLAAPCAVIATTSSDLTVNMIMIALSIFFICVAIGHAPSVVSLVCPNEVRGQTYAFYLLGLQMIGHSLGPLLIGLITDFVFGDQAKVGASMAIVGGAAAIASAGVLFIGLPHLRKSIGAQEASHAAGPRENA